ncbi:MAG: hypothetical protein ACXVAX_06110 [Pseudobdellovibrio sp.]
MKKLRLIVTGILFCFAGKTFAYNPSEGSVSAYVGPYFYKSSVTNSNVIPKPPNQAGLALIVLGDLNDKGSLELGFFYLDKIYSREQGTKYISEQTNLVHITMGYRRWFNDLFSGSVALYSAYPMGEVNIIHNDFANAADVPTSARETVNYGFDFALQAELWKNESMRFVVDTRYSRSVTAKASENADHYGIILGFHYTLQEKNAAANLKR